jgi:hypothetical protein
MEASGRGRLVRNFSKALNPLASDVNRTYTASRRCPAAKKTAAVSTISIEATAGVPKELMNIITGKRFVPIYAWLVS